MLQLYAEFYVNDSGHLEQPVRPIPAQSRGPHRIPVDVASVGANSCTSQPVCCTNTTTNGVVALGCSPVHINP
ncbi:hypothetical protein D9613_000976 [Agrocybe pediades]|uniref:Hydrophobin n=1 Tax=Agrocybe pediades TaxID=84607 RepID=A0A8H4R0C5_9AGAR|nr:hypothetical protein D9613_000976 [Agrocybe pediades]KAF9562991.1 hypothetical protein CPC08DRAFT_761130 [Agrocybe pediades]